MHLHLQPEVLPSGPDRRAQVLMDTPAAQPAEVGLALRRKARIQQHGLQAIVDQAAVRVLAAGARVVLAAEGQAAGVARRAEWRRQPHESLHTWGAVGVASVDVRAAYQELRIGGLAQFNMQRDRH